MSQIEITTQEYNFILTAQKLVSIFERESKAFKTALKSEGSHFKLAMFLLDLVKAGEYGKHHFLINELKEIIKHNTVNFNTCFILVFSTL